jgi:hypothetical protein
MGIQALAYIGFLGLGTWSCMVYLIAVLRPRTIYAKLLISFVATCVAISVLLVKVKSAVTLPNFSSPPDLYNRLFFLFNCITIYEREFTAQARRLFKGRLLILRRGVIAILTLAALFLLFGVWSYTGIVVLFFGRPALTAIRRSTLGAPVYQFPRRHDAALVSVGGLILVISIGLIAASVVIRRWELVAWPALLALLGHSIARNAGREVMRANGVEVSQETAAWVDLKEYEWCDHLGELILRIKSARGEVRIRTPQIAEVDAIFAQHGLKPL